MNFQYYSNKIKTVTPIGFVTIEQFIRSVQDPKEHTKDIFRRIQQASIDNNETLRAELKTQLYSFTPAVHVSERRAYKYITSFTGIMPLDFDKLPSHQYAEELKQHLFDEYKFIIAAWLSPSKKGVRAFVKIPQAVSIDHYKQLFNALEFYHLAQYNGFDSITKNCVLPMFQSWDEHILHRDNYEQWNLCYSPPEKIRQEKYKFSDYDINISDRIAKAINKITSNGHPQLRAAAYTLGGYVGSGKISQSDAENIIINLIYTNNYLNKKPSVYIRTAKEMIQRGSHQPI